MYKNNKKVTQRTVVVVDPYTSGSLYAPAFKAQGVRVIAVLSTEQTPSVYTTSFRKQDFDAIVKAHGDFEDVVATLKSEDPICIITGSEIGVELTDKLVCRILPQYANVESLATARRHKGDMAKAVATAGLPFIKQICSADATEVQQWLESQGLENSDLVIKPAKSAGTDDVTRVPGAKNWLSVFNDILGTTNKLGGKNVDLVVQEYVTGTEYVIDTFSHNGNHSVANICQYTKKDNGNFIAIYDKMQWLPPQTNVYDELVNYTKATLDAVGLRFGTAHVEIMITPSGPKLIEIGARPHGGGHPVYCRLATGDSQLDRAVRYFTSSEPIPESYELKTNVQVVFLICESHGYVKNAQCLEAINDLASFETSAVNVKNGDSVEPTKDLWGAQCFGFVVLKSDSLEQIHADYLRIRALEKELQFDSQP
ncbi:MAG: ATP-grasp domain-containing protein [Alteromonadaceae bacterium]|nr:ATP-grasp domain-containing protein [Alteromonadaceae bacterium]